MPALPARGRRAYVEVGFEIKFRQPEWLKRWLRYSKDFVRSARDKGDVI